VPVAAAFATLILLMLCGGAVFVALRPTDELPAPTESGVAARHAGWHGLERQRPGMPVLADETAPAPLGDAIGLLRRPQTAYDRDPSAVASAAGLLQSSERAARTSGAVFLRSVRRVPLGGWGALWLAPVALGDGNYPHVAASGGTALFAGIRLTRQIGRQAAAVTMIPVDPAGVLTSDGISLAIRTRAGQLVAFVVPDGVASVDLHSLPGSATSSELVQVHDNVAFTMVGNADIGGRSNMRVTWRDAAGSAIEGHVGVPVRSRAEWVEMPRPRLPSPSTGVSGSPRSDIARTRGAPDTSGP
jgi:hypothetical protein